MKNFTFFLCVLIVILGLPSISYSAKDTLPPYPTFYFCSCCGTTHWALVEDMPRDNSRSNLASIIFNEQESYNFNFSYDDFVPGEDGFTHWDIRVIDMNNDARAVITFSDNAGNDTTIQINYYAVKLTLRPTILDFGNLNIAESKEMDFWVINESSHSDALVTQLNLKDKSQGFELLDVNLPYYIHKQDSIMFRVKFTATQDGEFKDSIGIGDTCFYAFKMGIKADVLSPKIEVTSCNFGDVEVNCIKYGSITIYNKGDCELIISDYKSPKNPTIFIPELYGISEFNPLKINTDDYISYEVRFLPTDEKDYKDSIIFISNTSRQGEVDSVAELFGRGVIVESVDNLKIENEIELYPNPADDFLSINFNDDYRKSDFVRLFDYYGNVVYENRNIDSQNLKIRTSELASGMYFLQIGDVGMKKVVVVH